MPAPTTTTTYERDELAALAQSGREMEGLEHAQKAALRERLVELLARVKAVDQDLEEILDNPWLVGGHG